MPDESPAAKDAPKYQVQKLWERHHRMIHFRLLGYSYNDIATALGVTPRNVSDVLNSDIAKRNLEILRASATADTISLRRRLENLAPRSLDILEKVLDGDLAESSSIPVRTQVAQDLLDRHPETSKRGELHGMVVPVTPEIIAEALARAAAARKVAEAESVEFEEVGEQSQRPCLTGCNASQDEL